MCVFGPNFWVTLCSNDMRVCQEGRYLFTTIQRPGDVSTWNSEAVEEPIGGLSSSQRYVNPHSVRPAIIMSSWFSPIGGIVHQVISTPNRFNIQEDKLEFLTSKKSSKKKKLMVKQKTFVSQASRHLMLYRELVALINQVE